MLTESEYFGKFNGHPDVNMVIRFNAEKLLESVNRIIPYAVADGVEFRINPETNTVVSGQQFGGFRPISCPIGARHSSHKEGRAVDLYDPKGEIDAWCEANQDVLAECGLYMEHPSATIGWCHLTTRPPKSGNRIFYP